MSEFQYYEFQAIDRPLDEEAQQALRRISTRARITPHSLVNTYQWGDFKGEPRELVTRWFDLFVYWANWGSRRVLIRLPRQSVDADDDMVGIRRPPFHIGDLVEPRPRQAENAACPARFEMQGFPCLTLYRVRSRHQSVSARRVMDVRACWGVSKMCGATSRRLRASPSLRRMNALVV